MDLQKELEKYKPVALDDGAKEAPSVYVAQFNTFLQQVKGFTKQQLKTVQEMELIRDGIAQKNEKDGKLYDELLKSKTSLERQKKALLGGVLNVVDAVDGLSKVLSKTGNGQTADSARVLQDELQKNLTNIGLAPINRVGDEFDSIYHFTVETRREAGAKPNVVLEIVRTGYVFEGEVIRKADVIVNKK